MPRSSFPLRRMRAKTAVSANADVPVASVLQEAPESDVDRAAVLVARARPGQSVERHDEGEPYPLPFHPLDLGERAMLELFGGSALTCAASGAAPAAAGAGGRRTARRTSRRSVRWSGRLRCSGRVAQPGTWLRDPSRAARTVSSTTLRNVLFNAASCGGRAPTGTGLAPPPRRRPRGAWPSGCCS
jgi:hypothetical protein